MNAQPSVPISERLPPLAVLAGKTDSTQLTRVSLAYVEQRLELYLRFGEAVHITRLDHRRRVAVFQPGAVFCRVRRQANGYGTIRLQLMVMQACTQLDVAQQIPGVLPGARLLLHAEGEVAVRAVLEQINAIDEQGIAADAVSPAYWRTLGNRLAARLSLPAYTVERHAAWLAGRALQ